MKIRNGFVSNSSSSSFICCISGEVKSGYDLYLRDAEMCQCSYGHTMNQSYMDDYVKNCGLDAEFEAYQDVDTYEDEDGGSEFPYEVPPKFCPVCNMAEFDRDDMLPSALKLLNMKIEDLHKTIKEKFSSYQEFQEWLKDK